MSTEQRLAELFQLRDRIDAEAGNIPHPRRHFPQTFAPAVSSANLRAHAHETPPSAVGTTPHPGHPMPLAECIAELAALLAERER